MITWLKEHSLSIIGHSLLWGTPLFYILMFAIQFSQHEVTKWFAIELWSLLALGILAIIYISKLNKLIKERILALRIRENRVPPLWRFIQMIQYIISMGALILVVDVFNKMGDSVFKFLLVCGITGVIGYLFLMIDSSSRTIQPIH